MSNISRLLTVSDLIRIYGLKARSQLSQNFILDRNVTKKIASFACKNGASLQDTLIVEVGPEAGARRMVVIEKDARFLPTLQQLSEACAHQIKIIHGDVLTTSHDNIMLAAGMPLALPNAKSYTSTNMSDNHGNAIKRVHIVGNLPFSVATPLLFQLLQQCYNRNGLFALLRGLTTSENSPVGMTLMFQREVAERITATILSPARSRISVMTQAVCDVEMPYIVPSTVFVPQPKVDGGVVTFCPRSTPLLDAEVPFVILEAVVRYAFSTRRKIVKNSLGMCIRDTNTLMRLLTASDIDSQLRPQDIDTAAYCRLAKICWTENIIGLPEDRRKKVPRAPANLDIQEQL